MFILNVSMLVGFFHQTSHNITQVPSVKHSTKSCTKALEYLPHIFCTWPSQQIKTRVGIFIAFTGVNKNHYMLNGFNPFGSPVIYIQLILSVLPSGLDLILANASPLQILLHVFSSSQGPYLTFP